MLSTRSLTVAPLFAVALAVANLAFAQATAPATPTVTPAPNCEKPGEPPSANVAEMAKSGAEQKRTKWAAATKAYLDCLKHFIDEQQTAAALHGRAANAGVDEYNKAIKIFNDQVEAQKQQ
ncbi:MAG TPA: hypothetical protein VF959_04910 [Casimicrobiaceae bacterium]